MCINIEAPLAIEPQERLQPQWTGALRQSIHIKSTNITPSHLRLVFVGVGIGGLEILGHVSDFDEIGIAEVVARLGQLLTNRSRFHIRENTSNRGRNGLRRRAHRQRQGLFLQSGLLGIELFVEHAEIFHSRYGPAHHAATAKLADITVGTLHQGGDVFEVPTHRLPGGLTGERIEHIIDGCLDETLLLRLLFGRSVAESSVELQLRNEVTRKQSRLVVFNHPRHITQEIVFGALNRVLLEILTLGDVMTDHGKLNGSIDTVQEAGKVVHQGNQPHLIETRYVHAVQLKAAAVAAVFQNHDAQTAGIVVEKIPEG